VIVADIILHHYQNSPFSEKIRLILGYKNLAWKSVDIPAIMPKPDLTPLTGGYRRTPVMQIGADIYCDTALMADVLERLYPTPTLYPESCAGLAKTMAQWADSTLFWTMIPYCFQPTGIANVFKNMPPEHMQAFVADRAKFRGTMPRMAIPEANAQLRELLARLEHMLADGRQYLCGSQSSIADFSVYHCIWFIRDVAVLPEILSHFGKLSTWADRMAAFGHGNFEKFDAQQALHIARESVSAGFDGRTSDDIYAAHLGQQVLIQPADYGIDPVEGELIFSDAQEFALRRHDDRAGTVVVHFPRLGFQLRKLGAA
jgi:glutathione S-transferase